jgi:hypothetical protein
MKTVLLALCFWCSTYAYEFTLAWDNPYNNTNLVVELWSSCDMINWTLKETLANGQTNYVVSCTKDQEYFKIRNLDLSSGQVSEWSH